MIFTPGQLNRRAELYHQLGSMITAGIPLIQALQMGADNHSLRASRKTILAIIEHLRNGLTFSDSMARVQGWMPDFDIALLSAGEHSGRLDNSFKLLATYYETRAAILRETLWDMFRTVMTLHVFLFIFPLSFLIGLVMGIMNNNYAGCFWFIAEKVAVFGLLYGIVFFFIFACQGKRGERWRSFVESIAQMIPFLRTAQKNLALSRLTAALGALITSGVSIIQSWPMATAASGSVRLKREISTWEPKLQSGLTPSELVNDTPYFPEMFKNLYHTGEVSGKLDESLSRLQQYTHDEGFRTLRLFTRLLNGVIYALVAVMVGYTVITFYMNYFKTAMAGF